MGQAAMGASGAPGPYKKPGGNLAAQQLGMGVFAPTPQGTGQWGKVMPGGPPADRLSGGVAGAAISAPPLQGTQIPSSGPAPIGGPPPPMAGPPPPMAGPSPIGAGPLPGPAGAEPGPMPAPAPPPGNMTGAPITPNPPQPAGPGGGFKPGGFTGTNPYTQQPAQYGKIMPGRGGAGPLRPPGSV